MPKALKVYVRKKNRVSSGSYDKETVIFRS